MTDVTPSDTELLTRCAQADEIAWRALVKRYERLVHSIPLREGLSKEQAADVTQETFTILFKQLASIREPDRLSSWLMAVARRETWRRRQAGPATTAFADDTDDLPDDDDFTERLSQAASVYSAVQSLGEPCRSLIFGLFFDPAEPPYGVIAAELGRPVGSIGPLRGRCLDRLRIILTPEDAHADR